MPTRFEPGYRPSLSSSRMPTRDGFIYEPRGFWGYGRFDTETQNPSAMTVLLDRNHFYNGEKYPITLTHAITSPVNYTFDSFDGADPTDPALFKNNGGAAIIDSRMVLSVRQRQQYMRIPGLMQTMVPAPSWESEPLEAEGLDGVIRSPGINYYSWDFDAAMVIPRLASIQFDFTAYTTPDWFTVGGPTALVRAIPAWFQVGSGQFKGNARIGASLQTGGLTIFSKGAVPGPVPFTGDGFPLNANGQLQTGGFWQPSAGFQPRDFQAQNQESEGSVPIVGFGVMIDQQAYDTALIAAGVPGAPPTPPRIASLGSRIGTRVRMRQGGTGAWWWREGAPLALVCPTRTTGQVHSLTKPLTLGPGDNLEVELTFPERQVVGDETRNRVTQVGVSFLGYAAIEG